MGRHKAFRRAKDPRVGRRDLQDTKTRLSVAQAPQGRDSDHRWDPAPPSWVGYISGREQWPSTTRCTRCGCVRRRQFGELFQVNYQRGGLDCGHTPPPCGG